MALKRSNRDEDEQRAILDRAGGAFECDKIASKPCYLFPNGSARQRSAPAHGARSATT